MGLGKHIPPEVQGTSHARLLLTGKGPRPTSQLCPWIPPERPALGRRGVRTGHYTLVIDRMPGQAEKITL